MSLIPQIIIQLSVLFAAALMVFTLVYIITGSVGKYQGKTYDKLTISFIFMAYVVTAHLFWMALYFSGVKLSIPMFISFYVILWMLVSIIVHRKYGHGLLKSLLYGLLGVVALFSTEILASLLIGTLFMILGHGLSGVIQQLL